MRNFAAILGAICSITLGGMTAVSMPAGCAFLKAVAPNVLACADTVAKDAIAGMPLAQILKDAVGPCGEDVLAVVISTLLSSKDPRVVNSQAYKDAQTLLNKMNAAAGMRDAGTDAR